MLLPGFGGICLATAGIGFAMTLVNDLIIKGISGLFMKGYKEVTKFASCSYLCRYNGSHDHNIQHCVEALAKASNETEWQRPS